MIVSRNIFRYLYKMKHAQLLITKWHLKLSIKTGPIRKIVLNHFLLDKVLQSIISKGIKLLFFLLSNAYTAFLRKKAGCANSLFSE